MPDLIFIIILAVFIGGMLWSDRDSRRVRWYERDGFVEALKSLSNVGISAAKVTENLRSNIAVLTSPSAGMGLYSQHIGRCKRKNERQPLDQSHPIFHGKTAELKKASREALSKGYIITHRKSLTESEEKL